MMRSIFTGATGLKTLAEGMQVVGNNLANLNTVGFKQSMMLYQDMTSQIEGPGSASVTAVPQVGMGSRVGDVRTLFTQGSFETGSDITDLALSGKGFFQVTKDGYTHYTRAGNFRFTNDGTLTDPNGYAVTGIPITNGAEGSVGPLKLPLNDKKQIILAPKATTTITQALNVGVTTDSTTDAANPYFSLVGAWNGTATPPLGSGAYGYHQTQRVYDSAGKAHDLEIYFDGAPGPGNGNKVVEYLVTMPPAQDGSANAGTAKAGLLMSGTLTFNSSGQLIDMSAFAPTGDASVLGNWAQAPIVGGSPQFNATFTGGAAQAMTLGFGLTGATGWTGGAANAAAVGTTAAQLPSMGTTTRASIATIAYPGTSSAMYTKQDGYTEGYLMNLQVNREGIMSGKYSNGESADLYRIPVFRFISQENLRHEGMNHFSATTTSGAAEMGKANTSNYGAMSSNALEQSNVDVAREMVNLITTQRGFQSNSKIVTTADAMIQKALEIKR